MSTQIDLGKVVPEKGIDYFTQADKTEIQTAVETNLQPKLAEKELKSNKTSIIDENSTLEQYPDAAAVYNKLVEQDEKIAELEQQNAMLIEQIPTATAEGEMINVTDSSNLPLKDFAMLGNATQDGTPTPDNPVPINVVTGDNTVKVLGKNILTTDNYAPDETKNGITFTNNADGSVTINGTLTAGNALHNFTQSFWQYDSRLLILPAGTYTFSCKNISGYGRAIFNPYYSDGSSLPSEIITNDLGVVVTFTQKTAINFRVEVRGTGTTANNVIVYPQIEVGNQATDYEQYTEQTQLLSLGDIKLAKIGTYTDRIFKSSGKWYVEKNIEKLVLDQSSNLTFQNRPNQTSAVVKTPISAKSDNYISNHFAYGEGEDNKIVISDGNTLLYIRLSNDKTGVTADDSRTTVVNKFKTWLGNNNTLVYYILNTPTTTEITDTTLITQLEAILAKHTNKNVTNAWLEPSGTNAQAGLTLTYYQDLETLLNDYETRIELLETE